MYITTKTKNNNIMKKIYLSLLCMAAMMLFCNDTAYAQNAELTRYYLNTNDWVMCQFENESNVEKYYYDEKGRVTGGEGFCKNGEELVKEIEAKYEYDENDRMSVAYYYTGMIGGTPEFIDKRVFKYDDQGRSTGYEDYTYIAGAFEMNSKQDIEYNGDKVCTIDYAFNAETSSWEVTSKMMKEETTIDENTKQTIFYYMESDEWEPGLKDVYIYDGRNLVSNAEYKYVSNDWEFYMQFDYEYEFTEEGYLSQTRCKITHSDNSEVQGSTETVEYSMEGDLLKAVITVGSSETYSYTFMRNPALTNIADIMNVINNDRMFNIQGMPVGKNHRGIMIKNGRKYIRK